MHRPGLMERDSPSQLIAPLGANPRTNMNRPLSLVLLVVGVILVIYGINASTSVGSDVSRAVTGTPTDKSMWLLIGGAVLAIVGLVGSLRGRRIG